MADYSNIAASFQSISDAVDGKSLLADFHSAEPDAICSELATVLRGTILPRRVTVRTEGGARLSVVAKNRRIIKIAEVHPLDLWQGEDTPQDAVCDSDFDGFAVTFANTFLKVVEDQSATIEQVLLSDPLGADQHSGYHASHLVDHVEQVRKGEPDAVVIQEFYDAFEGQPRARFGNETAIDVPDGATVDEAWLKARVADMRDEVFDKTADLRFFVLEGETPTALALAWLGEEGAIVLSEDPEKFDELEQSVGAFSARL